MTPPAVTDVKHLHQIAGVVRAGRYFPPAALAAIRAEVATARTAG